MSDQPPSFDPEAVIDALGPLLGLPIEPAYRAGIAANLEVTARLAALVLAGEIDDEVEPAPIFNP